MHTKKQKGDIGLAKVIATLTECDFHVSIPISEHLKYDIVIEKDGVCKTMQVRFCTPNQSVLKIKLKSSWSNKVGNHVSKRKVGDFDYLGIYCPSNRECYFLHDSDFENTTQINLRLISSKATNAKQVSKEAIEHNDFYELWKRTQVAQGEGLLNL